MMKFKCSVIEGMQLHIIFWANVTLESYFFIKSWKSDPGFIKVPPSEQKKVSFWLDLYLVQYCNFFLYQFMFFDTDNYSFWTCLIEVKRYTKKPGSWCSFRGPGLLNGQISMNIFKHHGFIVESNIYKIDRVKNF